MANAVLVTGGAGYVGSHACKALAHAGYTPVTFDNLSLGNVDSVKWGPLIQGDTRNSASVTSALLEYDCIAVIHFAALSSIGESVSDPALYYDINVGGLIGVINGMRGANCDALIFSSTAAVYGEPRTNPIIETEPPNPINPYGQTKLIGERMLADHAAAYGLRCAALRYFNAAGADPDAEIGEFRRVETHLIPRALMALQGWITDFQVFGADFPTPDGTAVRDYVHVADLADAHVSALKYVLGRPGHDVFNIGTGQGSSVAQVLSAISRATGVTMTAPGGSRRIGDPAVLVADGSRARHALGFEPSRSDLDTIVRTAWAWHQKVHPMRV
ncbi:MAG: UDP-glucose 4-epimerase GalE [Brevundimonas sp.]|nr:UDP-glucose 4-epimerase GalE [Brevundimonas sp.]